MNIIYVKQAVKVKSNKRDVEKALLNESDTIIGISKDDIEKVVINTSDIKGVPAGGSIILMSDKKLTKYIAISVGASTKDIWCITNDGKDGNYFFEYAMQIDKKIFNGKHVCEALEESKTNTKLHEALSMIGGIASGARFSGLLSGSAGRVESINKTKYNGITLIDYVDKDLNDIDISVIGRKGHLHLLRIVPLTKSEIDVVEYIDDNTLNEFIAIGMIKDGKGTFSNRGTNFNFANVLPVEKLDADSCKAAGLKMGDDNKPIIKDTKSLEKFMFNRF